MDEHEAESGQERDPAPEMVPYRRDPGLPDTGRPSEYPEQVWPPPNPNAPEVQRPEWARPAAE